MSINNYKYIVQIEGMAEPYEHNTLTDALKMIEICMPCKATIESIEI